MLDRYTSDPIVITSNINEIYKKMLFSVETYGKKNTVRGLGIKDIGFKGFLFKHPNFNILIDKRRKLNYAFMFSELWWYLTGDTLLKSLSVFNKNIKNFSDDGYTMFGSYSPYICNGMQTVIDKLKHDIMTRQAVIPIYNMRHHGLGNDIESKDIPCTLNLHFISYNGKTLNLISHMRSQDLWWGFPYDVANFSMILCLLTKYLGMELGQHLHLLDSLHVYDEQYDNIAKYVNSNYEPLSNNYNHEIITSWLKDFKFYGSIRPISIIRKLTNPDDGFNHLIDQLLDEVIKTEPLMMIEHTMVMLLYMISKKHLPSYRREDMLNNLRNINSIFRKLF
jgi:thymidylate synthase